MLWSEKYRPSKLDDVILEKDQYTTLSSFKLETLPHLILSGPPGCGKTTTGLVLARTLLRDKRSFIELNASDNRGIGMINSLVDNFCRLKVGDPIMIIMLDEADNITRKAQQILVSQIMETMTHVRFIFTCNGPSELVQGIQSACLHLPFRPASRPKIVMRLRFIATAENFVIDDQALDELVERSMEDARKCVNNLQLLHMIDNSKANITLIDENASTEKSVSKMVSREHVQLHIPVPSLLATARLLAVRDFKLSPKEQRHAFVRRFHDTFVGAHGYIDFITMILNVYLKGEQLPFFQNVLEREGVVIDTDRQTKLLELTSCVYFRMMETRESPLLITKYLFDVYDLLYNEANGVNDSRDRRVRST